MGALASTASSANEPAARKWIGCHGIRVQNVL
jgi:hypothetical protein